MYPPVIRSAASAWLALFELYLLPLRTVATHPPAMLEDYARLQEEVWDAILAHGPSARIDGPIFTDEVVARAKAH